MCKYKVRLPLLGGSLKIRRYGNTGIRGYGDTGIRGYGGYGDKGNTGIRGKVCLSWAVAWNDDQKKMVEDKGSCSGSCSGSG